MSRASEKADLARKKALVQHVQSHTGDFNLESLARSYNLPLAEVTGIVSHNRRV